MLNLDLTPRQALDRLTTNLGLTDEELSGGLKASQRTIARWRAGETYPQRESRERLNALLAFEERLSDSFKTADAVRQWMRDESLYLGGMTPAEVIQAGRIDRADASLAALEWGFIV